jgi:serine/threonine-protein kinase
MQDLTGMMVGRFAIRSCLGTGGMGEVYRADDTTLKRQVALKRLAPHLRTDKNYRLRFLKEAERASSLSHQHIAGIYDVLEEKGEPFLVMEYVEGVNLRARLHAPLPLEQFWNIALQSVEALVAAHAKQIVHRDIKPENIMLTPAGHVKILDFGVAKRLPHADELAITETNDPRTGGLSGTPAYMAPEVLLDKDADGRSDIFSLGIVFYEALAGHHPFQGPNIVSTTDRILHEVPPPVSAVNPQVPVELGRIVDKMLAKNPEERYPSASNLLADLRRVKHGELATWMTPPAIEGTARPRPWGLISLATVLLAVVVSIVLALRHNRLSGPTSTKIPEQKNLVVLPFQAIGGDPQSQIFCDGLTATLTAQLTQLTATHALQVAPASEVWAKKVASADAARQELGGNLILAGTLYRSGDTLRVNIALEDASTRRQLRATTITAGVSDPFAVQDQAAESVVRMLELELQPPERGALEAHGTTQPAANDFYLQGRGYLQDYQKSENIDNAITVFNHALEKDPQYALAYAGLGEAYWRKYALNKDGKLVAQASTACARAVALQDQQSAGHTCLGMVYEGTGKYEQAAQQYQRAVELEPTNDSANGGLASAYEALGKLGEAEKTYRRAISLRPNYWAGYNWLGVFYYSHARYAEAAKMFAQVVSLAPDNFGGYTNLGGIYLLQGRLTEAIPALERSVSIRPTYQARSNLATAFFQLRRFPEAARQYEQALKLNDRDYEVWGNLGDAYYWAPGERDKAPDAYKKAIALADQDLQVNPRDAKVFGYLASYHAMLGEKDAALANARQALLLAPRDQEVLFNLALAYNQLGETDRAIEFVDKALAAGFSPTTLRNTPNFDALHDGAKFQAVLKKH